MLTAFGVANSQEITIVSKASDSFARQKSDTDIEYLERGIDTAKLTFVATVKLAMPSGKGVADAYDLLSKEARALGANSYMISHINEDHTDATLQLYLVSEKILSYNNGLKPQNTFYIFGHDRDGAESYDHFELNGAAQSLRNGTYFKYELKRGEQVKLRKGTVTGTTMWIKWKPDQQAGYHSLSGFYKHPVVKRTAVTQADKPGKFLPVESSLGRSLTSVLFPFEQE